MVGTVCERVRVVAPARLHLGFLDLEGGLGRRYGSLGLTVDGIATTVTASPAAADQVQGPQSDRVVAALARLRADLTVPPVQLQVETAIPAHVGLGSGTQLGLATACAVTRLFGPAPTPRELAARLERGARSGIGLAAFEVGGVVLDGGRGADEAPPPLIGRVAFPADWRVLLLFDGARQGLSGEAERQAFGELPPFPASLAGELCRLAVMAFMPAVATADLAIAGPAIAAIQRAVGDHFAPAQGGRFTSPLIAEALARLEAGGVAGVGQSSWGPTGFALLPDLLAAQLQRRHLLASVPGLDIQIAQGRNLGATVAATGSHLS